MSYEFTESAASAAVRRQPDGSWELHIEDSVGERIHSAPTGSSSDLFDPDVLNRVGPMLNDLGVGYSTPWDEFEGQWSNIIYRLDPRMHPSANR